MDRAPTTSKLEGAEVPTLGWQEASAAPVQHVDTEDASSVSSPVARPTTEPSAPFFFGDNDSLSHSTQRKPAVLSKNEGSGARDRDLPQTHGRQYEGTCVNLKDRATQQRSYTKGFCELSRARAVSDVEGATITLGTGGAPISEVGPPQTELSVDTTFPVVVRLAGIGQPRLLTTGGGGAIATAVEADDALFMAPLGETFPQQAVAQIGSISSESAPVVIEPGALKSGLSASQVPRSLLPALLPEKDRPTTADVTATGTGGHAKPAAAPRSAPVPQTPVKPPPAGAIPRSGPSFFLATPAGSSAKALKSTAAAALAESVWQAITDELSSSRTSFTGTEVPSKDTPPEPSSPTAPPGGNSSGLSGGGHIGSGGSGAPLLIGVLALSVFLLRRDRPLWQVSYELSRPSSVLLRPLERPG